jgi:hypothetical protein
MARLQRLQPQIPKRRLYQFARALLLVLLLLIGAAWLVTVQPEVAQEWGLAELGLVSQSTCAGLCQGCYCDAIINGTCYVNGRPSGCIGCVGACAGDNDCQCVPGWGGCGAQLAWCRSSDCAPRPEPTATATEPTPTPVPPTCDSGGTYIHIEEPAASWYYEPDYPVAIHQDPTFRGFDIVIDAQGGWAEKRELALQQRCESISGEYPADCPDDDWYWRCEEVVLEHHDDPLIKIELPMRLADSSVEWIEKDLSARYYHAQRQEPLPKVFELWEGAAMSVRTGLFDYPAEDPGVHGGKIILLTRGTPLNQPQRLALPYSVPVYLMDSTIQE